MIPSSIMLTHSPVAALKPVPSSAFFKRSITIDPSNPALWAIWRTGSSKARRTILRPVASSPVNSKSATAGITLTRAVPPPATIPSSTAARVALRASSMRSFISFNSVSVAAPTLITATPPDNFAKRSCNFSRSNSEVVVSIWDLITATRWEIASGFPAPSTITVLSLSTVTLAAWPRASIVASFNSRPRSSVITVPPVKMAISSSMALRRSPKPGALTATTLKVPRILFKTRVGRASPSTSSAIIKSGRLLWRILSRSGKISWIFEIFLSVIKMYGFSRSATIFSLSVTMYCER